MLRTSFLSFFLLLSLGQARFYESHEKPGEVDSDRLSGKNRNLPTPAGGLNEEDFEVHGSSTEPFQSRGQKEPLNVADEEAKARKRGGNVKTHVRTGAVPKDDESKNGGALETAIKVAQTKANKARSSRRGIDPDQAIEEEFTPLQTRVRGGVKGARSPAKAKADDEETPGDAAEKESSNGAPKDSTRTADDADDLSTKPPKGKKPVSVDEDRAAKGAKLVERSSAYPAEKGFTVASTKKSDEEVEGGRR